MLKSAFRRQDVRNCAFRNDDVTLVLPGMDMPDVVSKIKIFN